jgi:antitoxin VapB
MTRTVRLVRRGEDQLVPLPVGLHLSADHVRIRRQGRGVLIEPVFSDVREQFAALDSFGPEPFPDVRPTRAERRRR